MKISLKDSRILHLQSQLLWGEPTKMDAEQLMKQLSYIQLDTISVVARNQDLVAHARSSIYPELDVWKYLKNKKFVEGFAHARCLLHVDDFPFLMAKMIRARDKKPWWGQPNNDFIKWTDEVLRLIEDNGPIRTSEVPTPEAFPKATGWNNPNKRLLDYLFVRGYIMVEKRENFQPYFDLTEKIYGDPEHIVLPGRLEEYWFNIEKTLRANGPAPLDRLLEYRYLKKTLKIGKKNHKSSDLLGNWIKEGKLENIWVEELDENWYMLPEHKEMIESIDRDSSYVRFLSPLDSAKWNREALLRQYNYEYKMESYTPKAKRKYGFFALSIVYGPDFVGRVDPKYDRKKKHMQFIQWSWEEGFTPDKPFLEALVQAINRFLAFHGAESYDLGDMKQKYQKQVRSMIELPS